ncbi:MAG: hypothetical protein ACXW3X_10875, partial [Rhodoplanes sp.]
FSAKRRRTVSREMLSCSVSLTIAPANSSSVQRARPARYDNGPVSLDRQAQDRRQYPNRERVSDLRTPVSETRHTAVLTRC